MHEIAGLGELRSPWHECQMAWLQNHLNLINAYSQALESLDAAKGRLISEHFDEGNFHIFFGPVVRLKALRVYVHPVSGFKYQMAEPGTN